MVLSEDPRIEFVEAITQIRREQVEDFLRPLIDAYYPDLLKRNDNEYRKMVELSTKMMVVGQACTEIVGHTFDTRHQWISALYGGCCFLADSFIDDFGEKAARDYLDRFENLLQTGWFQIYNPREKLFYVILSRLFTQRDVLDPLLRQAIMWLYQAQRRDVNIRLNAVTFRSLSRQRQLRLLRECARDRSGHAILVLSRFLVPDLPVEYHHLIFKAGALIMHIDDHGDYYADIASGRITYMNQIRRPERTLRQIFQNTITLLESELPANHGRDLMLAFLYRYFVTRLKKKELERKRSQASWTVYE
ncbi:MAG: hypothetical protein Kow0042_31760 [Calditrichia bacterium]